jgi:hypothetical protein
VTILLSARASLGLRLPSLGVLPASVAAVADWARKRRPKARRGALKAGVGLS